MSKEWIDKFWSWTPATLHLHMNFFGSFDFLWKLRMFLRHFVVALIKSGLNWVSGTGTSRVPTCSSMIASGNLSIYCVAIRTSGEAMTPNRNRRGWIMGGGRNTETESERGKSLLAAGVRRTGQRCQTLGFRGIGG